MEKRKSLHELSADQWLIVDAIEHAIAMGEDPSENLELQELISQKLLIDGAVESKFDGYTFVMDELKARAEECRGWASVMEERIAASKGRAKSLDNKTDWMKRQLQEYMEANDLKKVETSRFRFSLCRNSQDPLELDEFVSVDEIEGDLLKTPELDRNAVRAALKSGRKFWWAKFGTRKNHVRIK